LFSDSRHVFARRHDERAAELPAHVRGDGHVGPGVLDDAQTQVGPRYALEMSINQNHGDGDTIGVRKLLLRAANMQVAPGGSQNYYPTYIDTSFTLRRGETVVLGTSVSDQQARVVLVTEWWDACDSDLDVGACPLGR
jgi:hypothetical protein